MRFGEIKDDISPGNYNSSFSEGSITEVFRREWLDVSAVVLMDNLMIFITWRHIPSGGWD